MPQFANFTNGTNGTSGTHGHHSEHTTATPTIAVNSEKVRYTNSHIHTEYVYQSTIVQRKSDSSLAATPVEAVYHFKTERALPRLG